MAQKISVTARQELVQAIGERYRAGSREEKLRILDEFVAVTGYHRKHSIRMLNTIALRTVSGRRPRLRLYDDAVREALVVLWEASDRICGKRLKPLPSGTPRGTRAARAPAARRRRSYQAALGERIDNRSTARGT